MISVGVEDRGGIKGVAGERCVASRWLFDRRERREEKEPRAAGGFASEIVVWAGIFEGLLCGKREDSSVRDSSSTASSSIVDVDVSAGASERVNPL